MRPGKLFCALLDGSDTDAALKRFMADYDVSRERAELCRDTSLVTQQVRASLGEKDVCLYVGIPFCPTRCSYCSFVSQSVEKSMKLIPHFMDALMQELDAAANAVNELGLSVISIYMGGGTPSSVRREPFLSESVCTVMFSGSSAVTLSSVSVAAARRSL